MTKEEITLDNIEITSNAVFYKLNKPIYKRASKYNDVWNYRIYCKSVFIMIS